MQKLTISNFSCIKRASLETSGLTVLIGPQATGKSVISKLLYFFNDVIMKLHILAEEVPSVEFLRQRIGETFSRWFPPSAWGAKAFEINFSAGPFHLKVSRLGRSGRATDKVQVFLADALAVHYRTILLSANLHRNLFAHTADEESTGNIWDISYQIRRESQARLVKELGDDYVENQVFIPAGRSWFTSIGRAIYAFENGGMLDPVTLDFGRRFTNLSERERSGHGQRGSGATQRSKRDLMQSLFGGEVKFEREREYVETSDGRKVPFTALSSGQQELLPLWLALSQFSTDVTAPKATRFARSLIYIEEPEAHLFPTAQSVLLDYIATLMSNPGFKRSMIITTHSPYVLSKINTLLKAGSIGIKSRKNLAERIAEVVPRASWLDPSTTHAYAIIDGHLEDIMDGDMIDGEYLDLISGDLSRTFNKLLELEYNQ